jgi:predicted DNA-binding transcriptional regulator YafY
VATKKHRVSKGDATKDARGGPGGERGTKRVDNVEMVLRGYEVARKAASAKPPTRKELAAEYGITPRAVNNLISFMKQIGINVVTAARSSDGKPAYTLRASDFLQLDMSVSEAVASVHLQQAVLGTPLVGDDRAAADSVHQITARLRDQVRSKLDALEGRFAVKLLRAAKSPKNDAFRVVLEGILENRVLDIDYESPYKPSRGTGAAGAGRTAPDPDAAAGLGKARKVETISIEPYGIFFARRSWYVVANKRPGAGMRLYKLARFKRVALTDTHFTMPRGWTIDGYLKNAWEVIVNQDAKPTRVVIEFDAKVAGNMIETVWHPSQEIEHLHGGAIRFTATVAGFDELQPWILGYGSHARVVAPKELRERVHAEIRAMHQAVEREAAG